MPFIGYPAQHKNLYSLKNYIMAQTKSKTAAAGKTSGTAKKATGNTAATKAPSPTPKNEQASDEQPMGQELKKFFLDALKDIYWAEKHLTKALPKMAKSATTEELKEAFENHLTQTEEHVSRLEQVFEVLGEKAQAKKCEAMEGLVKEADSIIEETDKGTLTRDVALIMAAQKVEHYEIATYGGLVTLAGTYGLTEAAELLQMTLDEEKETDENLTYIAENSVNHEAGQEGEETEEEDTEEDTEEEDEEA
jgi:ferritin-like metal-binding protein YciE